MLQSFPSDLPARETFALELLARMKVEKMDVEKFVDRRSSFPFEKT